MQPLLHDSPEAFLLVDDSVRDKSYSRFIELTKRQYSGNVHGIGLVNPPQRHMTASNGPVGHQQDSLVNPPQRHMTREMVIDTVQVRWQVRRFIGASNS